MSPKTSKKQILLNFFHGRGDQSLETGDLRAARDELRRHLGPGDRTSFGYIASILREAGYKVQYESRYSDPVMPEPYASRLKGLLEFRDLPSAERSLLKLDAVFHEYNHAGDQHGAQFAWAVVKKGKLRARRLAASPRLQESKRKEKEEVARWFQVWLETPELFARWLDLRKSSEEFRSLFGGSNANEER